MTVIHRHLQPLLAARDSHEKKSGPSGWAIFFIVVFVLLVVGFAGWFAWARFLRHRFGGSGGSGGGGGSDPSQYPFPARGGNSILAWAQDKFQSLKNRRSRDTGAGFESTGYVGGAPAGAGGAPRSGFRNRNALDPDEAWDARVGEEADSYAMGAGAPGGYYEEQELGLRPPASRYAGARNAAYSGTEYASPGFAPAPTGPAGVAGAGGHEEERGRSRSRSPARNPFGDDAEASNISMRGVSPRPVVDTVAADKARGHTKGQASSGSAGSLNDSPSERRSMFRENM